MKNDKPIIYRDFSRANIRTVQDSICPPNSVKLALNMDSDVELGSLVSRLGTGSLGTQVVDGATCLGTHYHRDTVGSNHYLFGAFSDGANTDIYNMLTGAKSLEDDTLGLKTRFCTFLGSTVRVNGTDVCKSFNGSAWVTSGGAFDEANMPKGKMVLEWKDRVYTAGVSASPNILYYSSIADPDTETVSWTTDNGYMAIEQEDGGGAITALEKVPGYILIFKERSMKRWDNSSTYPEDLVGVGAPFQEAVCRGRGMVFVANQEGLWMTNGGYPKKISKPIQDLWNEIDTDNIATYCDETYVYIYVGDITLNGNTYSNILFKYNIDSQTFDIYSYYNEFTCFAWYLSSGSKVIIAGDKDGQVLQLNSGNSDYPSIPITWSVETQDIDFGSRRKIKEISNVSIYSRNVRTGQFFYRVNSDQDVNWKSVRNITNDVEDITDFKGKGNWFNFKLTGVTDSGQIKIQGYEFPENSIDIKENVDD
jgi:hypothetical protein